jgi:hypothetical protein
MRRGVLKCGLTLALAATLIGAVTGTAAARMRVAVRPGAGSPSSDFLLRFRNPERTGAMGVLRRFNVVRVSGPRRGHCVSRVATTLRPAAAGRRVRVALNPHRLGGTWCAGRFHGRILEVQTFACPGPAVCAGPASFTHTLARFSFRVRRAAGAGGGSQGPGPAFAGLVSAVVCSGPSPLALPPKSRTFFLRWDPATDSATPSSQVVYDIFYASTPGGEDYGSPVVTTPAGATSYAVHIAGGGPAYFVVRARDQAGREDDNTVERAALLACG